MTVTYLEPIREGKPYLLVAGVPEADLAVYQRAP